MSAWLLTRVSPFTLLKSSKKNNKDKTNFFSHFFVYVKHKFIIYTKKNTQQMMKCSNIGWCGTRKKRYTENDSYFLRKYIKSHVNHFQLIGSHRIWGNVNKKYSETLYFRHVHVRFTQKSPKIKVFTVNTKSFIIKTKNDSTLKGQNKYLRNKFKLK